MHIEILNHQGIPIRECNVAEARYYLAAHPGWGARQLRDDLVASGLEPVDIVAAADAVVSALILCDVELPRPVREAVGAYLLAKDGQ